MTESIQASSTKVYRQAFMLDSDTLTELHNALGGESHTVTFTVSCQDGLVRSMNLQQLLAYPNSPDKQILSMTVSTYPTSQFLASTQVTFPQNSTWGDPENRIYVVSRGSDSDLSQLNHRLNEVMSGMKPWYNVVANMPMLLFFFVLFMTLVLYANLFHYSEQSTQEISKASERQALQFLFAFGVGLVVLNRLKNLAFPVVTYAIGQGKRRSQHLEILRLSLLLGVVASLIASFLYDKFRLF